MELIRLYTMKPGEWLKPIYKRLGRVIAQFEVGEPFDFPETAITSRPFFLDGSWLHPVKVLERIENEQGQGLRITGLESVENLGGAPLTDEQKAVCKPVRAIFG